MGHVCNVDLTSPSSQCLSVHYGFGSEYQPPPLPSFETNISDSLGANRVGEYNLVGGTEANPSGVNADFVAAIPDPPRAAPIIPLSAADTCPGLSTDGSPKRTEGGVDYKFYCGKWVQGSPPIKASYKVASLQKCVQDCTATP